jgi:glycosyltransferase involved in cell wall biosynthesis
MLFSILIPVIKVEHLRECLRSAIVQSFTDYEIIVVDDWAPEPVSAIVEEFRDERFHYVRTPKNLGDKDPTATWNFALNQAQGEFIVLLGDDDAISSNFLAEMERMICAYPESDVFRARLALVDDAGKVFQYGTSLPTTESWDEMLYFRLMYSYSRSQSTSEMCIRASALRAIGGYASLPLALGSDDLTWLLLCLKQPIVSSNRAFAYWRRHASSLSLLKRHSPEYYRAMLELNERLLEIIRQNEAPVISKAILLSIVTSRIRDFKLMQTRSAARLILAATATALMPPIVTSFLNRLKSRSASSC